MLKQMDAAPGAAASCEPSVPPAEGKKLRRTARYRRKPLTLAQPLWAGKQFPRTVRKTRA